MFPSFNNSMRNLADSKSVQDLFVSLADSATLALNEQMVHVTGFSGAATVTLPPVSEAVGRAYAIKVLDDASLNNITIADQDDSRGWSDLTIANAAGGTSLLFSDGETWHQLSAVNIT